MPLKVLQLCAVDFSVRRFLCPLIRFLEKNGLEVDAACSPGPFFPELEKDGFRMRAMPISRSLNVFKHALSTRRLYRFLKVNRYHVVHVHTPVASLIGRLAARLAKVPIIIYTAHGFYFHDDMPPLKRKIFIGLERLGGRWCDFIFTQSEEDRQSALRHKIAKKDRVITIGNGVDVERFSRKSINPGARRRVRDEFGVPRDAPLVGMIGRIVREKGYREFVEAAALILKEFPAAHFLSVGDALKNAHDDWKIHLLKLIEKLKLKERIHFAGMREDVPELLAALDLYTLPSYREGMPRSVIEAMCMELPVVVTDIRGSREEVVPGETGLIVPPRDSVALAAAIISVLSDPKKAAAMGKAGRARAVKLYSEKKVLQRQLDIYRRLIREKNLEDPS